MSLLKNIERTLLYTLYKILPPQTRRPVLVQFHSLKRAVEHLGCTSEPRIQQKSFVANLYLCIVDLTLNICLDMIHVDCTLR